MPAPARTLLHNARLLDLESSAAVGDSWLLLEDGKIAATGAGEPPAGAAVSEDMGGAYVLPGLWDVHVHPTGYLFSDPNESVAARTFRAVDELLDGLREGVTSVRSAGEADYIDCAAREFFARGRVVGPRVVPCGWAHITSGFSHGVMFTRACDGPVGWTVAVREAYEHGAEFFKILVSGGLRWPVPDVLQDESELEAAFRAAKRMGLPVLAHAATPEAVKTAVRFGARSIEHGYELDDEAVDMMKSNGTVFVPTLAYSQLGAGVARDDDERSEVERLKAAPVLSAQAEQAARSFQKALAAGVTIACGSDVSTIGGGAKFEIVQMVRFGMKPAQALLAATKTSAELCGYGGRAGVLAPGFDADILAVERNPLDDITAIRDVRGVWKSGRRVR